LTKKQVEHSPEIDCDQPVSRQMETNVYDHYGWYPYWGTGFYMGGYGFLGGISSMRPSLEEQRREEHLADWQRNEGDPHLRSIRAVTGYHIHATDGEVGHVEDFLLDDTDWSIHYLVVDTTNWWPRKKVLISPRSARGINWRHRLVNVDVDRQKVRDSPRYDATTTVDGAYERDFHSYYDEPPN
jgi:sporulation protein YlmC with PRC-barrel domain